MCGIAGIINLTKQVKIDQDLLLAMVHQLHHRGPDGHGCIIDNYVGLGHARLSIIDLEGGQQPIHNEDKSIWVVFNGEIFNFIELTQELKKAGHEFYTHSDTEVIVHLYEQYGDDFVNHLNGQFAIALWDSNRQRLLLVRDRPGIHPLFYSVVNNQLYFGSEVKAILRGTGKSPTLNRLALDELMTFWSPIAPHTVFDGVESLEPGNLLVIEQGKITKRAYWEWNYPTDHQYRQGSETDLADELRSLLVDATQIRLRSDVPVGAYLSGGLDSSALVSMIHHHSDAPLRTFSIAFEDEGLDESPYQKQMIEHVKTDHSRIVCKRTDIAEQFEKTIWHTESPILRTAPVPMGILSSLVREQNYKVVLTGEGSDEVLGGYDIFKETKIRQFWAKNPESVFRPLMLKRLYPYLEMGQGKAQIFFQNFFGTALDQPEIPWFSHLPRWDTTSRCKDFFSADMKAQMLKDVISRFEPTLPSALKQWHYFNRAQYIEAKSLMAGYLLSSQGDRMLMMNSVEGRFPFLDHRVIEFANSLDPRLKMKVLNEKHLLKQAMKKYVPDSIINRYKQPYRAPDIPSFFTSSPPEYIEELLSESAIKSAGYFDEKRVGLLMKKIKRGLAIGYKDNMAFVGILSTQLWHQQFIKDFHKNITQRENEMNKISNQNSMGAIHVS
ncbi:MAG: asparagine synthase (glutamine-hydrolyzing) [Gammaproteobacteria bacterium]|nr:asparagine synthase (glutamine-hydrolyzing) [Gammaproteobacteria bacterium]